MIGTLYLVATPIGHLGDITLRAVEVLRGVDFIACEDTRVSGRLLAHLGIRKPLVRCDDHTEKDVAVLLAERLSAGESGALVTDAGTPGIADPGYAVVRAALAAGGEVVPVPGASAVTAALSISGLSPHAFRFEGFLPAKAGPRRRRLEQLAGDDATQILFIPPHKLARWLPDLIAVWGDREACLARELTKKFEEIRRGRLSALLASYADRTPRGEIVLLVAGRER